MKRSVLALFVVFFLSTSAFSGVTFVASDDELNQSLVMFDNNEIQSLAISQQFYLGSAKQTKNRIRGLIAGLRGNTGKGVYVYGTSLDDGHAREMIGDIRNATGCAPVIFVVTMNTNRGVMFGCGSGSVLADTKEYIMRRIVEADRSAREK